MDRIMQDSDAELAAKASIGHFAMAMMDGTLGDADQEDVLDMAGSVAEAPHIAAGVVLGKDLAGEDDGSLDGAGVRDRMMAAFYDAQLSRMYESFDQEREETAARDAVAHREAVYAYSRLSPEDVARLELDADYGDRSLAIQAEERYYLG